MEGLDVGAKRWPPPPDLESLKELFAAADIEGLIADENCPMDEYDPEAKLFFEAVDGWATGELVVPKLLPILEEMWVKQFSLNDAEMAQRQTALAGLAGQIARFFGPKAEPRVR